MSTHALIFKKDKNGAFNGIYCHNDGYPEYLGALLKRNYKSGRKIDALISEGAASEIKESIETSVFYSRDKQEEKNIFQNLEFDEIFEIEHWQDYIYINMNKKWYFVNCLKKNFELLELN